MQMKSKFHHSPVTVCVCSVSNTSGKTHLRNKQIVKSSFWVAPQQGASVLPTNMIYIHTYIRVHTAIDVVPDIWYQYYCVDPFRTIVPFWGQVIENLRNLSSERECGAKTVVQRALAQLQSV